MTFPSEPLADWQESEQGYGMGLAAALLGPVSWDEFRVMYTTDGYDRFPNGYFRPQGSCWFGPSTAPKQAGVPIELRDVPWILDRISSPLTDPGEVEVRWRRARAIVRAVLEYRASQQQQAA